MTGSNVTVTMKDKTWSHYNPGTQLPPYMWPSPLTQHPEHGISQSSFNLRITWHSCEKTFSKTSAHSTVTGRYWLHFPPWQNREQSNPCQVLVVRCFRWHSIWERALEVMELLSSVWHPGSLSGGSEKPAKGHAEPVVSPGVLPAHILSLDSLGTWLRSHRPAPVLPWAHGFQTGTHDQSQVYHPGGHLHCILGVAMTRFQGDSPCL